MFLLFVNFLLFFAKPMKQIRYKLLILAFADVVILLAQGYRHEQEISRLECLQSRLGLPVTAGGFGGEWINEVIPGRPDDHNNWFFKPGCLQDLFTFNESLFCRSALQCKNLLFVGDSVMFQVFAAGLSLPFPSRRRRRLYRCPTLCKGINNTSSVCSKERSKYSNHHIIVCIPHCGGKDVLLSYVRHDHLVNVHGKRHTGDHMCTYWQDILGNFSYVFMSTGAHVPDLVSYPFGRATKHSNLTNLFNNEAAALAATFLKYSKPNTVLIWQSAHWGNLKVSGRCEERPSSEPIEPEKNIQYVNKFGDTVSFHWDKIPKLNEAYRHYLTHSLSPLKRVLLLDTAELMSSVPNCRKDYIHFVDENLRWSPTWRVWHLLMNLLIAYHEPTLHPDTPQTVIVAVKSRKVVPNSRRDTKS